MNCLGELSAKLSETADPELNLTRARIYLATGNPANARADLDVFIQHNNSNARAYINRAGTRFPADMKGVISDCDKAIELEPGNKNAWFLRGLARYELGEKEKACADFSQAIELGFSILRIAEEHRCHEFWQEQN
jgi:Tfp pilus assembly protein PilF